MRRKTLLVFDYRKEKVVGAYDNGLSDRSPRAADTG